MKFAFAVFVLISFTAVSSQLASTWVLDWQTQNSTCAASTFQVTGSSSGGYTIYYNYSSQTLNNPTCYSTLGITQNFNSPLTINSSTGAYMDSKNQNLNYYPSNNTILFMLSSPTVSNTPILFTPNGAYIPQEEVAGLVTGVWTGATYNPSSCQTAPPINISISISPSSGGVNSPIASYYYTSSSYVYHSSVGIKLSVPQTDQPIWTISYQSGSSNISYIVNPVTNQSTLQFQIPQSSQFGACIATYTRSITLMSGTWYPDWQNGNYSNNPYYSSIPTSIQVYNIFNMYMRVVFNFNDSSNTGVLYPSANGYIDSIYGDTYYPSSNTFIVTGYTQNYLFSPNGSILSADSFLGKWSNPQVDLSDLYDDSEVSDYCCMPKSIGIYNETSLYNMSALFTFDGEVANSSGCNYLRNDMSDNAFLQMYLTINSPNGTEIIWHTQYGYTLSFNNSDMSQLEVYFNYQGDTCNFAMTGYVPPKPLSAEFITKGISVFICILVAIFM